MKIAVASSGLGHVARGIETWARDTAEALAGKGVDVTLFAGAELESAEERTSNIEHRTSNVQGRLSITVVRCLTRGGKAARRLERWMPGFAWRWGLKSAYGWEQFSFWWRLWPKLRVGRFDVLHVQDPMLAFWCRRCRRLGLVKTKEILAHGTEEPPEFLAQFDYVQHLAPWHLQQAREALAAEWQVAGGPPSPRLRRAGRCQKEGWTAIPNFVDTAVFRPARSEEERAESRDVLGLPRDAFIVGTVAAVKRPHKRIDYLIREFAAFAEAHPSPSPRYPDTPIPRYFLAVAGASTDESAGLQELAEELAPGRVRFLLDLPRDRMPGFYRSLDMFVLVSLFEMMPIAVLEALASGLPLITNDHPVLAWMGGEGEREGTGMNVQHPTSNSQHRTIGGGERIDMAEEGALARYLSELDPATLRERGLASRRRAEALFAKDAVIDRYVEYYRAVIGDS